MDSDTRPELRDATGSAERRNRENEHFKSDRSSTTRGVSAEPESRQRGLERLLFSGNTGKDPSIEMVAAADAKTLVGCGRFGEVHAVHGHLECYRALLVLPTIRQLPDRRCGALQLYLGLDDCGCCVGAPEETGRSPGADYEVSPDDRHFGTSRAGSRRRGDTCHGRRGVIPVPKICHRVAACLWKQNEARQP
eukprot:scaffold172_cov254-Pinguiococcus_pyrenoidosus.AAC.41